MTLESGDLIGEINLGLGFCLGICLMTIVIEGYLLIIGLSYFAKIWSLKVWFEYIVSKVDLEWKKGEGMKKEEGWREGETISDVYTQFLLSITKFRWVNVVDLTML